MFNVPQCGFQSYAQNISASTTRQLGTGREVQVRTFQILELRNNESDHLRNRCLPRPTKNLRPTRAGSPMWMRGERSDKRLRPALAVIEGQSQAEITVDIRLRDTKKSFARLVEADQIAISPLP